MIAVWRHSFQVGWVGNGWPETETKEMRGEIVGYVPRGDTGASAIVSVDGGLMVVDVAKIQTVPA